YATPRGDHSTVHQVTLTTVDAVQKFVRWCLTSKDFSKSDFLCFDYETDNLNYSTVTNRLLNLGISFRHDEDKSFVIPLAHPETPFSSEDLQQVYGLLGDLFDGEGARWYGYLAHNAQFETAMTKLFLGTWIGEKS